MTKVYKYRGTAAHHFESLKNNEFYASVYHKLNDPMEGLLVFHDGEKNGSIADFLLAIFDKPIKITFKSEDNTIIKTDYLKPPEFLTENLPQILDSSKLESVEMIKNAINSYGIYSLSHNVLNNLMWSHYSDSHKGFVIEYDKDSLLKQNYMFHDVKYSKNPPQFDDSTIHLFTMLPKMEKSGVYLQNNLFIKDFLSQFLNTKSLDWEYEEEIRIITPINKEETSDYQKNLSQSFDNCDTTGLACGYHEESVTGIYFGLNMNEEHKKRILTDLEGRNISFYQMKLIKNEFSLTYEQLSATDILQIKR